MNRSRILYEAGTPAHADAVTPLIYESVHELMDFMFGSRAAAERVLARLLRYPRGQFGFDHLTVMRDGERVVGVLLGYGREDLEAAELPGAINMLRAAPPIRWPHLVFTVNRALSGYVPPPTGDAFYINNVAVDSNARGKGYGTALLQQLTEQARRQGYRALELDVTEINEDAIRFYRRHDFHVIGESGSAALFERYRLPVLKRMRRVIDDSRPLNRNNDGSPSSSTVVVDVTGLYPVQVDAVFAPGSVEQLQDMLRNTDKPLSIGGGRFSMGGQTALPGTLHIDMRGMNQVLDFDPEARTIRVQAGIRWKEVQRCANDYGLAVKVMQTYSNFTVGGSLSVNCHGRYVGLGPIVLSVRAIELLRADGRLVKATPQRNKSLFYGALGGYGALGIIVTAELELAENSRIERQHEKMPLADYPKFFADRVRGNAAAVFHNADMIPPRFERIRAITWLETDKPVNRGVRDPRKRLFLLEKYMLWAITETPAGHFRREYIYEPLLYLRDKVITRNQEADYDVAELEPLSRDKSTYVLQEYFVPVERLLSFVEDLAEILARYRVNLVNISIRHAHADPGSLLAWAREEVFALVMYYKQGTETHDRESVAVWTRELIDAVIRHGGAYYLPYQPHARYDQFHAAYPGAKLLFKLKDKQDPDYRLRNLLWEKYYRQTTDLPLLPAGGKRASEFHAVYGSIRSRDAFYRFLQVIYHLYPEDRFHALIIGACERFADDREIYRHLARRLPRIKARFADLTYALPALRKQKREMQRQTVEILDRQRGFDGYLEIGSTGRYVRHLASALDIRGNIYLSNDFAPDYSPPEIIERGGLRKIGKFFALADYAPIAPSIIADASVDLVTCYIGLHHCPRRNLPAYLESIHRVLRPGGRFVLRDHDAGDDGMRVFCSLVHTVFNAGLGVDWDVDRAELRLFEGVDFWVEAVCAAGFSDSGKRLLQANDPSLNTLLCFTRGQS